MLRFAVFDSSGPAKDWPLVNAHLLGPDDTVIEGAVRFRDGEIQCKKRGNAAAALCLQYHAGSTGNLMLPTSLLPDRDQPYILSVELARHRIKTFIAKSEEWQMFDLSAEHPAMSLWEQARRLFTQALTIADPVRADQAARKALDTAIDATEKLSMAHAEILLYRRYGERAASSATLGVRVWPEQDAAGVRDLIEKQFDLLVMPINWKHIEREEGQLNWDSLDRWMSWASEKRKPIIAGPLLNFTKHNVPKWMYVWQHDYDTCRDLAYDFVERVVSRYRGVVGMWNLATGLNINDEFIFRPQQMVDLVRMTKLVVQQQRKGARTMVEVTQPFGEYAASNKHALTPIAFLDQLTQGGVKVDAYGVQLLFGTQANGMASRDLMQISNMLDRFVFMERPIIVSALGVPSETIDGRGGMWREPWSPQAQQLWVQRMLPLLLSKPFIETVFWVDLMDHDDALLPKAGLLSEDGKSKPAFQRLIGMRKRLRKPLGQPKSASGQGIEV